MVKIADSGNILKVEPVGFLADWIQQEIKMTPQISPTGKMELLSTEMRKTVVRVGLCQEEFKTMIIGNSGLCGEKVKT